MRLCQSPASICGSGEGSLGFVRYGMTMWNDATANGDIEYVLDDVHSEGKIDNRRKVGCILENDIKNRANICQLHRPWHLET